MAKIICKLPNASELISGVKFVTHKLGMISEEIADEVAAEFVKIEGYVLAEVDKATGGGKKASADKSGKGEPGGAGDGKPDSSGENKSNDPPAGGSADAK